MRKTAPKGRKKYAEGGTTATTTTTAPAYTRALKGTRIPEKNTSAMERFNEQRTKDIAQLTTRLARPQVQQNADRVAKLTGVQTFLKNNPMASYSDARRAYNFSIGKGARGPAKATTQQTTAMKKGGVAKKPAVKKSMGRAKGRA